MKKILIGGLLALFAIAGLLGGKIYMDSNNMENIVKSDKGKEAIRLIMIRLKLIQWEESISQ